MGRRRRKRLYKPVKRRIPRIFSCPRCGARTVVVSVTRGKTEATVTCGDCELAWTTDRKSYEEKVDVYSRFVDAVLQGEVS